MGGLPDATKPETSEAQKTAASREASLKADTADGLMAKREDGSKLAAAMTPTNGASLLSGENKTRAFQSGSTDAKMGNLLTKRNVGSGGGRKTAKHQVYISKDEDDADGSYVEIPNSEHNSSFDASLHKTSSAA